MTANDGDRVWARLKVYSPNGTEIGTLSRAMAWEMGSPLNDMSSLSLTYHESLPNADLLRSPCEVALEIGGADIGGYVEYPNCRFLNLKRGWNQIDRTATSTYTLPSYGWQLRKVRFATPEDLNEYGRRVFENVTVGAVLRSVLDEGKSRGNIPGMTYTFTASVDSAGQGWDDTIAKIEFEAGQDAWSILDAFARQGLCDWRMNARALEVYKPETVLSRNLAAEGPGTVIFHPTNDHTDEPTEETLEDLASALVVIGDKRTVAVVNDPTALQPWGKWEETVRAGGVSDTPTLTFLGQQALSLRTNLRVQLTKDIMIRQGTPVPFYHFLPGDIVIARGATGVMEPVRVRQITLSLDAPYGLKCNVVLNDRFTDRQMKYEQWVNSLSGQGGPGQGGGGDVDPLPAEPDPAPPSGERPAAPTGVTVTTTTYIDNTGRPVGQAHVTWNPVTTDKNGQPLTPKGYQVATRRTDLQPGLDIGINVLHPQTDAYIGPLDGGFTYRFTVTAQDSAGYLGDPSTPIDVLIPLSTVAPPKPSTPVLTSKLSTVRVEWDGLTATGTQMPKDLTRIRVEMSTTGGTPWTNIGEIFRGGSAVVTSAQTVGATRYFRFTAENSSGLSSPVSNTATITVTGVQGPDIEANSVTTNNLAAGSVTAEKVKAYSLSADRLSIGAFNNAVSDPMMANADLNLARYNVSSRSDNTNTDLTWTVGTGSQLGVWSTATKNITLGTYASARWLLINNTALNIQATQSPIGVDDVGRMTQIVQPLNLTAGVGNIKARIETWTTQGDTPWVAGGTLEVRAYAVFYKRDGTRIGSLPPPLLFSKVYTAPNNSPTVVQSVAGAAVPDDAAAFFVQLYVLYNGVSKNAQVYLLNPEVWQENSVYIGDGMIKAPLIEANAITTDKLDANAITAKHTLTGPLYQTSSPGSGAPRVEISPNANFLNQAGMVITPSSGNHNKAAQLFLIDDAGTGGWRAGSFVMVGPETTRNSTGRVDYFAGIGGDWWLKKEYVDANWLMSGVEGYIDTNILALYGSMPTRTSDEAYVRGVFRAYEIWWNEGDGGSLSYGIDNGSYYKVQGSIYSRDSSVAVINIEDLTTSSFSWRANQYPKRVNFFLYRNDITF